MQTQNFDHQQFIADLSNFCGTSHWYQHSFAHGMSYTDGVKYFAERTGSFWLIDLIAAEFFTLLQKDRPILSIKVVSEGVSTVITVTDGNEAQITCKHIQFSTLVSGTWKFYLTDGVLLLPSEY